MTIFHTSILTISTYFVFLYFHLFTVPTMPRARALVIRRRFYKLPSVSRIFHTFVWLFVPPAFCLRRLFRVPTTWILLASLAKLSSNHGTRYYHTCECSTWCMYHHTEMWVHADAPPGGWRLCFSDNCQIIILRFSFDQKRCFITFKRRASWSFWSPQFHATLNCDEVCLQNAQFFAHLCTLFCTISGHEPCN